MATLIKPDGRQQDVQPEQGQAFTLRELQGFVGGCIQMMRLADKRWMVINEEGKLTGLPHNAAATDLYMVNRAWYDAIVGNALVCTPTEAGEDGKEKNQ